jgi:hypothetical protein
VPAQPRASAAISPQEAAFGRPGRDKPGPYNRAKYSSAALTIWRVASAASAADVGPGAPRWDLTLVRCRGGRVPRSWLVEWDGAQLAAPTTKQRPPAPAVADTTRRVG